MALRQYQRDSIASIRTDADADALMRQAWNLTPKQMYQLKSVPDALQRGEKLIEPHVDVLAKVYTGESREDIAAKVGELNASPGSPSAKVAMFMSMIAGAAGAPSAIAAYREMMHNRLAVGVAERRRDTDNRTRAEMAARFIRKSPLEATRMLDERERRATVAAALDANPRFRQPDRYEHADRLGAAAPVLHGRQSPSLRDTVAASFDSHAAMEHGKEIGVFDESTGVPTTSGDADIGGHDPL